MQRVLQAQETQAQQRPFRAVDLSLNEDGCIAQATIGPICLGNEGHTDKEETSMTPSTMSAPERSQKTMGAVTPNPWASKVQDTPAGLSAHGDHTQHSG